MSCPTSTPLTNAIWAIVFGLILGGGGFLVFGEPGKTVRGGLRGGTAGSLGSKKPDAPRPSTKLGPGGEGI